jgi:HlyD family secretion protein
MMRHVTAHPRRLLPVLAVLALLSGCRWPWGADAPEGTLTLPGTVEAHEVPVAFQVGGRIAVLRVDEGDRVTAGDVMAELDPEDARLDAARTAAEAESAAQVLAAMVAGTRPQEVKVARATLARAEADLGLARTERDRVKALREEQAVPQADLDRAERQVAAAEAARSEAAERLNLAAEGPRAEDVARARADHAARAAAAGEARRRLAYARLGSPVDGVVTLRQAERGEVVQSGQAVFRVAETAHPWVRAYLDEPELPRVRLGEEAEVRADGLKGTVWKGRLTFIAQDAEFTPKVVETRELRSDLVYRIKVEVEDPTGSLKIGMPVDVRLTLQPGTP